MHTVSERSHARTRSWLSGVILVAALAACSSGDKTSSKQDTATAVSVASTEQTPGEKAYVTCATCHQPNGEGLPGAFPPLAGGEFVNSSNPALPIMIVMHGLQGPVTVKGQQYNSTMPAYGTGIQMSNKEVAAVLTYVRSSWGNNASAITEEDVEKVRKTPRQATGPVTAAELEAIK